MKNLSEKALEALQKVAKEVQTSGNPYVIMKNRKVTWVIPQKNSYKFFANRSCKFFPCHKGLYDLNCIWCYCPIFQYRETNAICQVCGPCEQCTFPHRPKNYDKMIKMLKHYQMEEQPKVILKLKKQMDKCKRRNIFKK